MAESKIVRVSGKTYNELQKRKVRQGESIDETINRLLREQGFTETMLKEKFNNPETVKKFAKVVAARIKEEKLLKE